MPSAGCALQVIRQHALPLDVFDTRTCGARGVAGCTPVATFDVDRSPFVLAALYPRTYQLNTRTHVH